MKITLTTDKAQCTGFLTKYCRLPEGHEGECSYQTSTVEQLQGRLSKATDKWNKAALRAEHAEESLAAIKRVTDEAIARDVKVCGDEVGDEAILQWISQRTKL